MNHLFFRSSFLSFLNKQKTIRVFYKKKFLVYPYKLFSLTITIPLYLLELKTYANWQNYKMLPLCHICKYVNKY